MSLQVVVPTCDKYVGLMDGFFHQWQKYCGLRGVVVVETLTPQMPVGWSFLRSGADHDDKRWTGNLKAALYQVTAPLVLLVLDDYWLTTDVDRDGLDRVVRDMTQNPTIDKVDLTNDRIGFEHVDYSKDYVRSTQRAQYLTSTQAAIWRREFLLRCLHDPAWSPWEFELKGSKKVEMIAHKILGCKVPIIHYANIMLKGNGNLTEINKLRIDDLIQCGLNMEGKTK